MPKYIFMNKNKKKKYQINYKNKYYGSYKTLEEALNNLNKVKEDVELKRIEEINSIPKIIIRNENGECIIELFNKKKEKVGETIVDEEIYYELIKYKWCLNGYVFSCINNKCIRLHRYVINYIRKDYIDHINNNPLDNRKNNLRIVTPQQNMMNKYSSKNSSSKYIGVGFDKRLNNWRARIHIDGKEVFLGRFKSDIEAAKARDLATKEHFGEYGKLNFLNEIK